MQNNVYVVLYLAAVAITSCHRSLDVNEVIYCHRIRRFKKGEHLEGLQNDSACGFNEHSKYLEFTTLFLSFDLCKHIFIVVMNSSN